MIVPVGVTDVLLSPYLFRGSSETLNPYPVDQTLRPLSGFLGTSLGVEPVGKNRSALVSSL